MRMCRQNNLSLASKTEGLRGESPYRFSESGKSNREAGNFQFMLVRRIVQTKKLRGPAAFSGETAQYRGGMTPRQLHAARRNQIRKKANNHRANSRAAELPRQRKRGFDGTLR